MFGKRKKLALLIYLQAVRKIFFDLRIAGLADMMIESWKYLHKGFGKMAGMMSELAVSG